MRKRELQNQKTLSIKNDIQFKKLDTSSLMKNAMIKEAFHMFDTNNSGDIDKKEFKKLIITLGLEISDKKILELMKTIDKDHSGSIDLAEFTEMMKRYQFHSDSPVEQHIENAFNLYDKDGDGFINGKDIEKVAEELEEIFSYQESDLMIKMCKYFANVNNLNKDSDMHHITKEEFSNFLFSINFLEEVTHEDIKVEEEIRDKNPSRKSSYYNMNSLNSENSKLNNKLLKKNSTKSLKSSWRSSEKSRISRGSDD